MHFVKKGVSQATTFDAFCSFHDKAVFAPLEDAPFSGTREQLFLLYFRALARELYLKRCQIESTKLLRELDRGRSLADQWAIQEAAAGTMDGIDLALRDLGRMWKLACDALESKNFDSYRSALIYFESVPGMACCGGSLPTFDFGGHRIQTLGLKAECDFLSFTVLPLNITRDGRAGVAAFVWHEDAQQASAIPESLLKFPVARQADAILRLAFETLENVVLSVSWWEGLSASARDRLEGRMRAGLVPLLSTVESLAEDGYQDASWVAMGGSAL